MNNTQKATLIGGGTTGFGSFLALYLFQRYGVPVEATAAATALIGALVGKYAAKLDPNA